METMWIIIITVLGGVAAAIFLIEFVFEKKIRRSYRILLLVVFGFLGTLLVLRLITNNGSIINPESSGISKTDSIKKQDVPEKNKAVRVDSNTNKKKLNTEPTELINNSEKADFALIVTINGKKDNHLTGTFVDWLKNNGTVSQSILQSLFIEQGYFNQILDGNSSVIKKTNAAQSAKNLCLVRTTITYTPSKIDESLIVANCIYEVVVVETATGRIIDSFEQKEKSSGISEEMAKQRAEDDFIKYLNQRKLSL